MVADQEEQSTEENDPKADKEMKRVEIDEDPYAIEISLGTAGAVETDDTCFGKQL